MALAAAPLVTSRQGFGPEREVGPLRGPRGAWDHGWKLGCPPAAAVECFSGSYQGKVPWEVSMFLSPEDQEFPGTLPISDRRGSSIDQSMHPTYGQSPYDSPWERTTARSAAGLRLGLLASIAP